MRELPHDSNVSDAMFSHDGLHVATTTFSGVGRLWSTVDDSVRILGDSKWLTSDKQLASDKFTSEAFAPDGRRIVTIGPGGQARIWNLDSNALPIVIGEPDSASRNPLAQAAFLPDGRRVITSTREGLIRIWDAEMGTDITPPSLNKPARFWAMEGKWIALVSSDNVSIWDSERPERLQILKRDPYAPSVAVFSPDGQLVATDSDDRTVNLWNVADGELLAVLHGHTDDIFDMSFSRDGLRLITVSHDRTVRVWNGTAGGEVLLLSGKARSLFPASFSPDSRQIVGAAGNNSSHPSEPGSLAAVWNTTSGAFDVKELDAPINEIVFAPDGKRIVATTNGLRILGMTVGAPPVPPTDRILAVSADRKLILLGGGGQLHVWDVSSGAAVRVSFPDNVARADFSPDNKHIVVTSAGGGDARIFGVAYRQASSSFWPQPGNYECGVFGRRGYRRNRFQGWHHSHLGRQDLRGSNAVEVR
jgi:WD40 repeat protein